MESNRILNLLRKSVPIILILLGACSGDNEPEPMVQSSLQGVVKDDGGRNYDNVNVVATQANSEVVSTTTDPKGEFSFIGLDNGDYEIKITPPLATNVQSVNPILLSVGSGGTTSAEFTLGLMPVTGIVIGSTIDPYGEIKNVDGIKPIDADEKIYARNIFTDGKLIPILAPDGHQILYGEWQEAQGEALVSCSGKTTNFKLQFSGLIPNGVYTVWISPMAVNKSAKPSDILGVGALGDQSGNKNIIIADDQGAGELNESMPSGPLSNLGTLSTCALTSNKGMVLILDYHIDGQTYGATNGPDDTEVGHMIFIF